MVNHRDCFLQPPAEHSTLVLENNKIPKSTGCGDRSEIQDLVDLYHLGGAKHLTFYDELIYQRQGIKLMKIGGRNISNLRVHFLGTRMHI